MVPRNMDAPQKDDCDETPSMSAGAKLGQQCLLVAAPYRCKEIPYNLHILFVAHRISPLLRQVRPHEWNRSQSSLSTAITQSQTDYCCFLNTS